MTRYRPEWVPTAIVFIELIGLGRIKWYSMRVPVAIHALAAVGFAAGVYITTRMDRPWQDHPFLALGAIVFTTTLPYALFGFLASAPPEPPKDP